MGIPANCCWIPEILPKTKTSENYKKKNPQKIMNKVKHQMFRKVVP